MVTSIFLLGLLCVATATDVARHKIYNATTYSGILVAFVANGAGTALLNTEILPLDQLQACGWIGIATSFLGFLTCGFLLLVCYVFFQVGGGDVKLFAMVGAFLGPQRGIEAALWTFVLGACMGLIVLIWRVGPFRLAGQLLRHVVWTVRCRYLNPLGPEERAQLQPPLFLAPSALVATAIVQWSLYC